MNTDPTLSPKEQLTQFLIELPTDGVTDDLRGAQRFLDLARDHELMSSLDEGMRRAILARVRAVLAHHKPCRQIEALLVHRIGQDGSYTSERDRDTFLMLANDPEVLMRLPDNVRLQILQRVHMVRQWQAHAA